MRIIELDGRNWQTILDCYNALIAALGSPQWHGRNLNAFIDSMIWGGMNVVEPPYVVRILGTQTLPPDVRQDIDLLRYYLTKARHEYRARRGGDIEVSLEIAC